jgi:hypothetical protein
MRANLLLAVPAGVGLLAVPALARDVHVHFDYDGHHHRHAGHVYYYSDQPAYQYGYVEPEDRIEHREYREYREHDADGDNVDVDIDALRADVWRTEAEWILNARYKVKTEHAAVGRFDLQLDLYDRDLPGGPVRVVVPLDSPSRVDGDDVVYIGSTDMRLADADVRNPGHLRVRATVVPRGGGPTLAHDSSSVKYRR